MVRDLQYENYTFEENDELGRKVFADNILKIIEAWDDQGLQENKSLSISLDSPWGTGKSMFLSMIKGEIDKKHEKWKTAKYDAWSNDDCKDPFLPLAYCIGETYAVYHEDSKEFREKAIKFLECLGTSVIKGVVWRLIGKETAEEVESIIKGVVEEKYNSYFDEYKAFQNAKKELIEAIEKMVPDDGKLVIFIDELDRCRPTFAIETLEYIKHYFNVKGVVFIFAVDLTQLAHSIKTVYGSGMDASGYLRRFFDLNIKIPEPEHELSLDYIKSKVVSMTRSKTNDMLEFYYSLFTALNLALRDINKIVVNFNILLILKKDRLEANGIEKFRIYLYFMCLKYKYPEVYEKILDNKGFKLFDEETGSKENGYFVVDKMYTGNSQTYDLLHKLSLGKTLKEEHWESLIVTSLSNNAKTFGEHMRQALELYTEVKN